MVCPLLGQVGVGVLRLLCSERKLFHKNTMKDRTDKDVFKTLTRRLRYPGLLWMTSCLPLIICIHRKRTAVRMRDEEKRRKGETWMLRYCSADAPLSCVTNYLLA